MLYKKQKSTYNTNNLETWNQKAILEMKAPKY